VYQSCVSAARVHQCDSTTAVKSSGDRDSPLEYPFDLVSHGRSVAPSIVAGCQPGWATAGWNATGHLNLGVLNQVPFQVVHASLHDVTLNRNWPGIRTPGQIKQTVTTASHTKCFLKSSGCQPHPPETSAYRPRLTVNGTHQKETLVRSEGRVRFGSNERAYSVESSLQSILLIVFKK